MCTYICRCCPLVSFESSQRTIISYEAKVEKQFNAATYAGFLKRKVDLWTPEEYNQALFCFNLIHNAITASVIALGVALAIVVLVPTIFTKLLLALSIGVFIYFLNRGRVSVKDFMEQKISMLLLEQPVLDYTPLTAARSDEHRKRMAAYANGGFEARYRQLQAANANAGEGH